MYDYLLGGLNNFAADRVAVERVLAHLPQQRASAIENRRFIDRAVRFLAAPAQGITQFLDVGAGLPTKQSVHEVARWVNPASRVAYVDYDPVVVSHGKAMLAERECSVFAQADLRDPVSLLHNPEIRQHLDFSRPVGLIVVNVMHWIPDPDRPQDILKVLLDALASGSYLVLTHMSVDQIGSADMESVKRAARVFEGASAPLTFRSRDEILCLFDGWALVPPGLVTKHEWRPDPSTPAPSFNPDLTFAGIASKS